MNIAVIPARGGSKRIPRKNIKLFNGLPVISYAIAAAKDSALFDQIVVSTDDEEIAEIAISFGASIPWMRQKDLSDDYSTTISVMQDAVNQLDASVNDLKYVCCIYPATPLLSPSFLRDGLRILKNGNWDYVVTASLSKAPPERSLVIGNTNEITMRFPGHETTRTQDFPPAYFDAGQFYWGRKTAWQRGLPILTSKSTILELPRELAVDIDTLDDWHYAERIFKVHGKDSR
jgi:N-acylneuraminate cytidylyltransferase